MDTRKASTTKEAENHPESRGISPGARIKDVFKPGSRKKEDSPPISPDRTSLVSNENSNTYGSLLKGAGRKSTFKTRKASKVPDSQAVISPDIQPKTPNSSTRDLPLVNTGPKTPTSAGLDAPLTTVTPPTPTDQGDGSRSPSKKKLPPATTIMNAGVSASGDTTLHRRVISDSASHAPSKLSNAIAAPLTPTIEESKTPGTRAPGTQITSTTAGGFFSSVFTAAQNAASTLTNTISNNPPRPRSAPLPIEENAEEADNPSLAADGANTVQEDEKKPLAVETLGSGNLSLDHLGISTGPPGTSKSSAFPIVANGAIPRVSDDKYIQRDEAAARAEDVHAARAVSEAYSENTVLPAHTIIAEDTASIKPRSVHEPSVIGDKTPPNDNVNVNEIERGTRRSGSVRSRVGVVPRRHRNSSSVTGNTITAALSAGHAGLANPIANGSTPKLTGFAVASKKRNRDFHQSFKSVPDDDYLIEDYSCALQREILLAGRLYVSEGHICFSSNILGWVTTVIISFDEVVSIEKESTAVVFPNAIAIQTLQARHTFRSLLSREATYELLIGIWKLSHPNLISSVNGSRIGAGDTGDKTEKVEPNGSDPASDISEEEEIYDEDEEENDSGSVKAVPHADGISVGDDEASITAKGVSRKASNIGTAIGAAAGGVPVQTNGRAIDKAAAVSVTAADFPGPATHAPTECADKDTHFEKLLKDEVIPAPLGKIYSMMFGPASGGFISKWLIDEIKVTELQLEDDKKGLTDENKTRFYSYIKPLYAAIGPKSTKCLSTENLDYLDLEKAVSVTITTQTPEVPSGNVFSVKTRYCLMWAPGNATRVVINCGIEWTGKSWLKGTVNDELKCKFRLLTH